MFNIYREIDNVSKTVFFVFYFSKNKRKLYRKNEMSSFPWIFKLWNQYWSASIDIGRYRSKLPMLISIGWYRAVSARYCCATWDMHAFVLFYAHKDKNVNYNQILTNYTQNSCYLFLEFFPWFLSTTGSTYPNVKKAIC